MRQLKKRTLALVLASVVTVVGSFAAENYKNCLMALAFKADDKGSVHILLETEQAYSTQINPIKKDANTYVIMLPDVNSADSVPIIGDLPNVSSVNVRTMPYSSNGDGYTRVTIKTINSPQLYTYTRTYIPSAFESSMITGYAKQAKTKEKSETGNTVKNLPKEKVESSNNLSSKTHNNSSSTEDGTEKNFSTTVADTKVTTDINEQDFFDEETPKKDSTESLLLIMGVLLIISVAIYSYIKAKDKLTQIAGEKIVIDLEDDAAKKKKNAKAEQKANKNSSTIKIKNTIKNLDKKYPKSATIVRKDEYIAPVVATKTQEEVNSKEAVEESNVVDLDALFKEQVKSKVQSADKKEEEENAALEEFLTGFSFDEDFSEEEIDNSDEGYDLELYNSTINDNSLKFTEKDIECIGKILNTEIQDSTLRDIEKFVVSNPIKRIPTKKEILEEIVSTYAISQNIVFTGDDIDVLNRLICVEIDRDFVEDLRTNPERTKEMYKEIKNSKSKKPSEILTLNVKDVLPDLSEALKQYDNKKIESNNKPETIYYSEGYDVAKLKISEGLPDLTKELNKKDAYVSKPTAQYDIVDNSYSVSTLKISTELPDLADVMAHPEKYQTPKPKEFIPDEQALLENIANVTFKPFDDGTRQFEIINDLNEMSSNEQDYYIDLDEPNIQAGIEIREQDLSAVKEEDSAKNLLKQVRRRREERDFAGSYQNENVEPVEDVVTENVQCLVDGEAFKVLDSINFTTTSGCYLVKNSNGYAVMGFVGDKLNKVKLLETVNIEKIHARVSEVLANGSCRYIVRVGSNKFIVNADNNFVEYVMDL